MNAMTAPADHAFSKRDVERLVRELVPPIATETAKAVATETAKAVVAEVTRTVSAEVSRGVTEAMTTQFRVFGMESGSADAIARQHRRNQFTDDCLANRPKHDDRMRSLDEMARDYDPEDRVWVKEQRRRQEQDVRTVRETFIRWAVPAMMGALLAIGAVWWREDRAKVNMTPMPVIEADRGRIVVQQPTPAP